MLISAFLRKRHTQLCLLWRLRLLPSTSYLTNAIRRRYCDVFDNDTACQAGPGYDMTPADKRERNGARYSVANMAIEQCSVTTSEHRNHLFALSEAFLEWCRD